MKKMLRKIHKIRVGGTLCPPVFILTFILYLLTTLTSCGIATYPVLYKPYINYEAGEISFTHNTLNHVLPNFITLGYDLIYRVYDDTVFADETEAENKILTDQSTSLKDISAIISNTWLNMVPYRRVNVISDSNGTYTKGSGTPPIYLISDPESDNSFQIYIRGFSETTPGETTYLEDNTTTSSKIYFNRYLKEADETKTFSYSDFETGDKDTPFLSGTIPNRIRIAFFVYTIGLSTDYLSLHSDVVYIGSVVVQ